MSFHLSTANIYLINVQLMLPVNYVDQNTFYSEFPLHLA